MISFIGRIPIKQRAIFLIAILLLLISPSHLHAQAQNCNGWTQADAQGNTVGAHAAYWAAAGFALIPGMQLEALGFLILGAAADIQNWYCTGGGGRMMDML
jgi:hypothetical protein